MSEPHAATRGSATTGGRDRVEVLVALDHARLVRHLLSADGDVGLEADDSPGLGLTRIRLPAAAVDPLVAGLARRYAQDAGVTEPEAAGRLAPSARRAGSAPGPLDTLLRGLRTYFSLRYAGWTPTMGKNRTVGQVMGGGGRVSYGGGPDPVPAPAPAPRPGSDGAGVSTAVLDTGVVPHPSLAGRYLVAHQDLLEPRDSYPFPAGHATFVAGLVLDQAPGATVRLARVLGDDGLATSWDVANAIVEHARAGVDIVNLSLVCYTGDGRPPLALAAAVDRLPPDVLVVACAGNHGDPGLADLDDDDHRRPAWPAALDDVVAVGSAHPTADGSAPGYELSPFTPPGAAWVDLVTQGEDLVSTYFTGAGPDDGPGFDGGARWSGTSFAAARVTGRVAAQASRRGVPVREAYEQVLASAGASLAYGPDELPPFLDLSAR